MEAKTTEWRPGPTVCRCCLAEGCYKDISTEYFWMGKREVYAEMLSETFDVTIAYSQSGGPNSNSRLICEPCISRLRDASEFKRQVLECEKTFIHHLDPGTSHNVEIELDSMEKDVKLERVKLEKSGSDEDDAFDDRGGFADDDDDEDDLDNQPLTKLASKIPKKESVDLMDLLDNAKAAEKRKSTTKVKASPAKKLKTKKEAATAKPAAKVAKVDKRKKKDTHPVGIMRSNARLIVRYSTAYPFRLPDDNMVCVYCGDRFTLPSQYRIHMDTDHTNFRLQWAFCHVSEGYLKTDCTDLRCRVCSMKFERLADVASHLVHDHNHPIDLEEDLGVQEFKFEKDKFICVMCNMKHSGLRNLSRHMQTHYAKFTCEQCGKSYATYTPLHHHIKRAHNKEIKCYKCNLTFASSKEEKQHFENSERCRRYICTFCHKRFMTPKIKEDHMMEVHGKSKKVNRCTECGSTFENRARMRAHFIIEHTDNYLTCSHCGMKFPNEYNLKKHIIIHTDEKAFQCPTCSKKFNRKKNLVQHMWIHSENKRFECKMCQKKFNQRVCWKAHMRGHHPELVVRDEGDKFVLLSDV